MPPGKTAPIDDETARLAELIAGAVAGRMADDLDTIKEGLIRLEMQAGTDHELVQKHNKAIYGNGEEGLKSQVKYLLGVARVATWILATIAGALLVTAVGTFIYLASTHPMP